VNPCDESPIAAPSVLPPPPPYEPPDLVSVGTFRDLVGGSPFDPTWCALHPGHPRCP